MDPASARQRLHLTLRHVALEPLGRRVEPRVLCPRKHQIIPVVDCRGCEHFSGLCLNAVEDSALLRCTFSDVEAHPLDDSLEARAAALTLERVPVSMIMSTPVRYATPDMSLEDLAALLLSEKISAVPVVDDTGKPIGIATKTDAMQRYYDHAEDLVLAQASAVLDRGSPHATEIARAAILARDLDVTVSDIMSRSVFFMGTDSSVTHAAALMAYEQIHHVLIMDDAGTLLGIVSCLDIARWLARSDGYVVPRCCAS